MAIFKEIERQMSSRTAVVSLLTDVSYLRLISSHCGDIILLRLVLVVLENWFLYYHR